MAYTYTIRDVDKLLLTFIKSQNYSVRIGGIDIRFRHSLSTPDELISRRRFPAINIESGVTITTPEFWQKESRSYAVNQTDNTLVDVKLYKLIDVKYTYKVGFYVNYKSHSVYMEQQFLKLFSNFFTLTGTDNAGKRFAVEFMKDGGLLNLDEFEGDLKLYRRDQVLVANILMTNVNIESLLRPHKGIQIKMNEVEIIGGT